jgi:hypothetical protein
MSCEQVTDQWLREFSDEKVIDQWPPRSPYFNPYYFYPPRRVLKNKVYYNNGYKEEEEEKIKHPTCHFENFPKIASPSISKRLQAQGRRFESTS